MLSTALSLSPHTLRNCSKVSWPLQMPISPFQPLSLQDVLSGIILPPNRLPVPSLRCQKANGYQVGSLTLLSILFLTLLVTSLYRIAYHRRRDRHLALLSKFWMTESISTKEG